MGGTGSGRKSRFHDLKIAELAEMSVVWAIDNFKQLSTEDKMKILTCVAARYIKSDDQGDRSIAITIINAQAADKDRHPSSGIQIRRAQVAAAS